MELSRFSGRSVYKVPIRRCPVNRVWSLITFANTTVFDSYQVQSKAIKFYQRLSIAIRAYQLRTVYAHYRIQISLVIDLWLPIKRLNGLIERLIETLYELVQRKNFIEFSLNRSLTFRSPIASQVSNSFSPSPKQAQQCLKFKLWNSEYARIYLYDSM